MTMAGPICPSYNPACMSAIDELFANLRREKRKALMPFVTAGDPDLEFTAAVLKEVVARCHLCEVGIPYSDPIADGPVIQASLHAGARAQDQAGRHPEDARRSRAESRRAARDDGQLRDRLSPRAGKVRRRRPRARPRRADRARPAGRGIGRSWPTICAARDISLIQLVTPTTPRERAVRIAETSTGFLYYVSVAGITGERTELPPELVDNVGWLRTQTDLPICIGFGISTPEHVKLLAPVADGLIVGSAIVRRIADRGRAAARPGAARRRRLRGRIARRAEVADTSPGVRLHSVRTLGRDRLRL